MEVFEHIDEWVVGLDLLMIVGLLVFTRIRPWVIFGASSCLLLYGNVLSSEQLLVSYTNISLLTLVLLLLVSIPLERTAFIRGMTDRVIAGSGRAMLLRLSVIAGLLSAFINNTAIVASLLGPLTKQKKVSPSQLLLPLSNAAILGGMLTLVGTSTNLIVNGFVQQAGYPSLHFFQFTTVALPVFVVCILVMLLIAPYVLPKHEINSADDEGDQDYFLERRLLSDSPLVGRSVQDNGLRQLERMFLVEVIRGDHQVIAPVGPHEVLQAGDTLVFTGDVTALDVLEKFEGLAPLDEFDQTVRDNLVEVIISPTSALMGKTVKEVDFRARFDAAVVAVRRGDQRLKGGLGNLVLRGGDSLILAVGDDFSRRGNVTADFIRVGGIEVDRPLANGRGTAVLTGFGLAMGAAALSLVSLEKSLLALLTAFLVFRVVTLEDLRNRFPYELFIVIGGALGLSQAMIESGLAADIGLFAEHNFSQLSLMGALIGVFIVTWLITELVTNNAAAAIMFPMAMAISSQWDGGFLPFVMAVAFGASASFLSPYGYQTHLMVYTAGNYRVKDFAKLNSLVLVAYMAVSLSMIWALYVR